LNGQATTPSAATAPSSARSRAACSSTILPTMSSSAARSTGRSAAMRWRCRSSGGRPACAPTRPRRGAGAAAHRRSPRRAARPALRRPRGLRVTAVPDATHRRPADAEGRAGGAARLGGREDAEVPVGQLAEASGGVPQRLHRAAGEWARTQAVRRLTDTASRIAAERRCCARPRTTWWAISSSCRRRANAPSWGGRGGGRRCLPVQGSRLLSTWTTSASSSGASGSSPRWSRG